MRLAQLAVLTTLLSVGCQSWEWEDDYGIVCVAAQESDGHHSLVVQADSADCASDHRGAKLECTITLDGSEALIETRFKDGRDPDDSCAPSLSTTCEVEVEPGTYTLVFADLEHTFVVPNDEEPCVYAGASGWDDFLPP